YFSSPSHAAMRLALSRDRRVAPKPSSSASIETLTKSPGFTSTCPASLRNSSEGMMLSDFSPAFTTTKLSSTESTSAVITSPTRISLRLRLSSKSAANDSPPDAGADFGDDFWDDGAVEMLAIKKKPFQTASLHLRVTLNTGQTVRPAHPIFSPDTRRRCAPLPRRSKALTNRALANPAPEPAARPPAWHRARPGPEDRGKGRED